MNVFLSILYDSGIKSVNDIKIITDDAKASEDIIILSLFFLFKNITILPINVERPAKVVSKNEIILSNEEDENDRELKKNQKIVLDRLMTKLNPRCKYIINAYFGLDGNKPKTLEEIGNEMGGLSRERIRQLKEKALRVLRSELMMMDNMELLLR